jgi:hypothetical protein
MSDKLFVPLLLVGCLGFLMFAAVTCDDTRAQANQETQFLAQPESATDVSFWRRPELNWAIPLAIFAGYGLLRYGKR